ncbi:MAG: nuclear transport factor 2 family protein [Acidimicrobiaceae bacterium]|nr:nuclear transport factor 2 family protein [Acidimicrobiaceae bacterium]
MAHPNGGGQPYRGAVDLQTLVDRAESTDLLTRYAGAVDGKDWDLFRSVFTPGAHIDHSQVGGVAGDLDTVVGFLEQVTAVESMQHLVSNIDIALDGDEAKVTAVVYNPPKLPDSPMWATGGWYHHELVRTPEGWRSRSLVEEAGWFDGVPEPEKPVGADSAG